MQNEHELFDTLKKSPDFEPRKEFVQETKGDLINRARKMEYRRKVKRFSVVTSSIAVATLMLVWVSLFGGKQVIFDTVASLWNDENDSEIVIDPSEENIEMSENGVVAKSFLEAKGYEILSYEGSGESYELTNEKLVEMPYMQQWWMQPQGPVDYIGNIIETEFFTVKNHPLDDLEGLESLGETSVSVIIIDEIAVGGTSWPVTTEPQFGGPYSLHGKTLEELYGVDYATWHDAWIEKFSNDSSVVEEGADNPHEGELLEKSETIFRLLEQLNWTELADHTHPEKGIFFSFYADAGNPFSNEVTFSRSEFGELDGSEPFIWGYDMGDYAFEFTVNDYISKFIVNHSMRWDGENSQEIDYEIITFNNSVVQSGGIINTIPEYFPEAKYVEYYSPPPSDDLWHQWQALRFIYEQYDGSWYLIGIARDVHSP